jgi:hypothetical protein
MLSLEPVERINPRRTRASKHAGLLMVLMVVKHAVVHSKRTTLTFTLLPIAPLRLKRIPPENRILTLILPDLGKAVPLKRI